MSCVFCESTDHVTEHHIIPRKVRKMLNWNGKRAEKFHLTRKVLMCRDCHDKFNYLVDPLVYIMQCLRPTPPIPIALAYIIEDAYDKLNGEEE